MFVNFWYDRKQNYLYNKTKESYVTKTSCQTIVKQRDRQQTIKTVSHECKNIYIKVPLHRYIIPFHVKVNVNV